MQAAIQGCIHPPTPVSSCYRPPPLPHTPSVPVTLTTVAVNFPLLWQTFSMPSFSCSRGMCQLEWSGRQLRGHCQDEGEEHWDCWNKAWSLWGREDKIFKILAHFTHTAPHTYYRVRIKHPPSSFAQLSSQDKKKNCSKGPPMPKYNCWYSNLLNEHND